MQTPANSLFFNELYNNSIKILSDLISFKKPEHETSPCPFGHFYGLTFFF